MNPKVGSQNGGILLKQIQIIIPGRYFIEYIKINPINIIRPMSINYQKIAGLSFDEKGLGRINFAKASGNIPGADIKTIVSSYIQTLKLSW